MGVSTFIDFGGEIVATAHIVAIRRVPHHDVDGVRVGECGVSIQIFTINPNHWIIEKFRCWPTDAMLVNRDEHAVRTADARNRRDERFEELRRRFLMAVGTL